MRYRITAEIEVIDEGKLVEYARQRFRACWQDSLDSMVVGGESLVERALLEAVLFSNENPSPDEWGVEFYTGEVEALGVPDEGNEDGLNRDVPPFDNDPRTDEQIKQSVYDAYDRGEWD